MIVKSEFNAVRAVVAILLALIFVLISLLWGNPVHAGDLPDPQLTPGEATDTPIDVLCHSKTNLTRDVPESLKQQVFAEYGMQQEHRPDCTGPHHACFQIDHLDHRKNGGADKIRNLWPQAYDGTPWNAHVKDRLEQRLIELVCVDKTLTQQQAFACITSNWIACYQETFK